MIFKGDYCSEKDTVESKLDKKGTEFVSLKDAVKTYEQTYIKAAVDSCNGKISAAANLLGIHRTMIYRKLESSSLED